jgi:ADP-ribose pyrophosphatase YjhB (NUDIX family)
MKEQFKIYIAAYLVLEKDEKILLLKRANTGFQDGKYSLVSGHFDGNETAEECIIREAKEEVNIALELKNLTIAHTMHRFSFDREYIDVYITYDKWSGEIKNLEPKKCDDLSWFPINSLPDNTIPGIIFALDNIKNKKKL